MSAAAARASAGDDDSTFETTFGTLNATTLASERRDVMQAPMPQEQVVAEAERLCRREGVSCVMVRYTDTTRTTTQPYAVRLKAQLNADGSLQRYMIKFADSESFMRSYGCVVMPPNDNTQLGQWHDLSDPVHGGMFCFVFCFLFCVRREWAISRRFVHATRREV